MKKILFIISFLLVAFNASAEDIYLAASAAGGGTGVDCANAKAYTFFNDSANWGEGAGEIDPGDTCHICGIITASQNTTLLTVQTSGTAGNVITVKFEDGAVLQAPYFATTGAINIAGKDYIKIDGGTNGIIQNTDNGASELSYTYNASSHGINSNGATDLEICNLTIQGMYMNTSTNSTGDSDGWTTSGIFLDDNNGNYTNIKIHDCHIHDAHANIWINFEGITVADLEIYNNYLGSSAWKINAGAGNIANSNIVVDIHDNEMTDWDVWDYPYHGDGLIVYANSATNSSYSGKFYNNYVHGNLGYYSPSGYLGCGCGGDNFLIYNNLFVCEDPDRGGSCMVVYNAGGCTNTTDDGTDDGYQPINTTFLNNTAIGAGSQSAELLALKVARALTISHGSGNYMTVKNNIFKHYNHALHDTTSNNYGGFDHIDGDVDYNLYYDLYAYSGGQRPLRDDDASYDDDPTLAIFYSTYGQEEHGISNDPNLDTNYYPTDSSLSVGTDLSVIFTTDKAGATRSIPWTLGAYQTGGTTSGTVFAGGSGAIAETEVVTGGNTIVLNISGTTFNTFDNTIRAAIVAGLNQISDDDGATDWGSLVEADENSWSATGVVRTDDDTCTITLPDFDGDPNTPFNITQNGRVQVDIPATAVVSGQSITCSPIITISVVAPTSTARGMVYDAAGKSVKYDTDGVKIQP